MTINILKNSVGIDKLGWGNLIEHIDVDNILKSWISILRDCLCQVLIVVH